MVSLWAGQLAGSGWLRSRDHHTFPWDKQQYRKLIETMDTADVLAGNWMPSATLIGASQETVTLQGQSGKTIDISSALEPEARARFRRVADAMRATVPQAAWLTKDRAQKSYQDSAQ